MGSVSGLLLLLPGAEGKGRRRRRPVLRSGAAEVPMNKKLLAICLLFAAAFAASGQTRGPGDPRERNFKFFADGVQIGGVVGYRIDFARIPITVTDQRRLGIAYAPD